LIYQYICFMEKLSDILFYNIDKAIRSYRAYAQKQLKAHGHTITIDQWLVMKAIMENPGVSQQELAEMVFKDTASVTRIIELLVKAGYMSRETDASDRRKTILTVKAEGLKVIRNVQAIILENRNRALEGIAPEALEETNNTMKIIMKNVT
jgi:MarR family transcriptional regulator, transcriptional regulator for hemolysin